jgi:hypothetical protein
MLEEIQRDAEALDAKPVPIAYLVAERREGDWMLGDEWTSRCDTLTEALDVAERWRQHRYEVGVFAVVAIAVGNVDCGMGET